MSNYLFIFRGAPGSGKTTLAHSMLSAGLVDVVIEADQFFISKEGEYKWDRAKLATAHIDCIARVQAAMHEQKNIALSNTSVVRDHIRPYIDLAKKAGYITQEIILSYPIFENKHGVPEMAVQAMQRRLINDVRNFPQ